jgi:hypothetical protein
VKALNGNTLVRDDDLVIVVFEHAKGAAVNFIDWKWIGDEVLAKSWGRWTGMLHVLCRYGGCQSGPLGSCHGDVNRPGK